MSELLLMTRSSEFVLLFGVSLYATYDGLCFAESFSMVVRREKAHAHTHPHKHTHTHTRLFPTHVCFPHTSATRRRAGLMESKEMGQELNDSDTEFKEDERPLAGEPCVNANDINTHICT